MQCKDIPDFPILALMAKSAPGTWHNWYLEDDRDVSHAMPVETPDKLRLAKMRQLIKRGLVSGCPCGCRGDFELTDLGLHFIETHNRRSLGHETRYLDKR